MRATARVRAATKKSTIAPTASQIAGTTGATQTIVNQAQRMRNANRASDNASTKQNQAILRKYRRRFSFGICSMRGEIVQWIIRIARLRNMDLTRPRSAATGETASENLWKCFHNVNRGSTSASGWLHFLG